MHEETSKDYVIARIQALREDIQFSDIFTDTQRDVAIQDLDELQETLAYRV